ncbi:MAG: polysaccharide biosynthesis protein, partial [Chloroflexi bacterium]|nr:polysaccharide biosynthesis protein [Chloroflexota bacterium]
MTIPEAVQLVLQAATLGKGGEVFVLDMGKPIKIVDLARDLIRLSGLEEGQDIDIVFTGLRPDEKMFEELYISDEKFTQTGHEKIFVARNGTQVSSSKFQVPSLPPATCNLQPVTCDLSSAVDALIAAARAGDAGEIRRVLQVIVPEYQPTEPANQPTSEPAPITTPARDLPALSDLQATLRLVDG